jgi:hypothetical protein
MSLTFSGTAGHTVSLQETLTTGNPLLPGCAALSILAPDGSTQVYSSSCYNYTSWFSDAITLPSTGTYTLKANTNGTGFGTTSFTLFDATNATATVSPGSTVLVPINAPGQNAALTFSETAGHRISLLTQFPGCYGVSITAPDGSTSVYNNAGPCTSDFSGVLPTTNPVVLAPPTLAQTGTYSISLNPTGTGTGQASFSLYDVPADATNTATIGGSSVGVTTTVPGQAGRVTFAGVASHTATVGITTSAGGSYTITVLTPAGGVLLGTSSSASSYSTGSLSLATSGTYTIVVAPTSTTIGTYNVGVTTP